MGIIIHRFVSEGYLYTGAFVLFLLASISYFLHLKFRRKLVLLLSNLLFLSAFALITAYIARQWISTGQPPFKTMFQSLVFLVWNISIVYFFLEKSERLYFLGGFAAIFNALTLFFAGVYADVVQVSLPPALRSFWFIPHVVFYFAGYAFLFIGFLMSILYLLFPERKYLGKDHWSGQLWKDYDEFSYRAILFGYTFLTFGLVVGAVWAKVAWGNFWSWDPKENWALITWFVYLAYLHLRYVRGWKGKKAAVLSIIGFVVIIITYIGVNYLPSAASALHAYQ